MLQPCGKKRLEAEIDQPRDGRHHSLSGYANLWVQRRLLPGSVNQDVRFIRWDPDDKPRVEASQSRWPCRFTGDRDRSHFGQKLAIDADLLALAAAVIPSAASQEISQFFKVPLGPDGFFQEAHVKLRPVEFAADGVYLCGMAHYPKHIPEAINQAYGAAGRV
jgi:heterodisulfide reductase subunit A